MADTIFAQKPACLASGTVSRRQASMVDHPTTHRLRFSSEIKYNCFSLPDQSRGFRVFQNGTTTKMNMAIYASLPPEAPVSVDPSSPGFWELIVPSSASDMKVWILGSLATLLLSFTRGKWGPLLQVKEKIDTAIDEAERVADVVEEVAEKVEKVAEGAAKNLPEGKLQDVAEYVEKMAENIDRSAEIAEAALEKVEDMGEKLESFVESTTYQEKTVSTVQPKEQK